MTAEPDRRKLRFETLDEIVQEVDRLADMEVETTGKYSYGQILEHLARILDVASGHLTTEKPNLMIRMVARVLRPKMLRSPMQAGYKLPDSVQDLFWPSEEVDVRSGQKHFHEAIERFRNRDPLPPHPIFGKMNRDQSDQLQCRHCELHLGFVHPVES